MATSPTDPGDRPSYGGYSPGAIGRMPIAGNAELIIYLLALLVVALIWIISDDVGAHDFARFTVALTFGYLISRGIAKAGRVDEH